MARTHLDARAFNRAVSTQVRRAEQNSGQVVRQLGGDFQKSAKSKAPIDKGDLVASIDYTYGANGQGPYVDVSAGTVHAAYQEFGTSKMPAQPYFRPALGEVRAEFTRVGKRILR